MNLPGGNAARRMERIHRLKFNVTNHGLFRGLERNHLSVALIFKSNGLSFWIMKSKIVFLFTLALGFMPLVVLSQGTVYLSNLDESANGISTMNGAQSFVTGSASDGYLLDSVTLLMGQWAGGSGSFSVLVFSNVVVNPTENLVGTLEGNTDPASAGEYVYTASDIILAPNTTYWIVTGGYAWQFTSSGNYASANGWNMAAAIINAGAAAPPGSQLQFALNATPVPEPSIFSLFVPGCLILGLRRSSRNTSHTSRRTTTVTLVMSEFGSRARRKECYPKRLVTSSPTN